jgi:hypothetical protein
MYSSKQWKKVWETSMTRSRTGRSALRLYHAHCPSLSALPDMTTLFSDPGELNGRHIAQPYFQKWWTSTCGNLHHSQTAGLKRNHRATCTYTPSTVTVTLHSVCTHWVLITPGACEKEHDTDHHSQMSQEVCCCSSWGLTLIHATPQLITYSQITQCSIQWR